MYAHATHQAVGHNAANHAHMPQVKHIYCYQASACTLARVSGCVCVALLMNTNHTAVGAMAWLPLHARSSMRCAYPRYKRLTRAAALSTVPKTVLAGPQVIVSNAFAGRLARGHCTGEWACSVQPLEAPERAQYSEPCLAHCPRRATRGPKVQPPMPRRC